MFPSSMTEFNTTPPSAFNMEKELSKLHQQIQETLLLDESDVSRRTIDSLTPHLLLDTSSQHERTRRPIHSTNHQHHHDLMTQQALQPFLKDQTALISSTAHHQPPPPTATGVQALLHEAYESTKDHRIKPVQLSSTMNRLTSSSTNTNTSLVLHPFLPIAHSSLSSDPEALACVTSVNSELASLNESLRKFQFARMTLGVEFRQLVNDHQLQLQGGNPIFSQQRSNLLPSPSDVSPPPPPPPMQRLISSSYDQLPAETAALASNLRSNRRPSFPGNQLQQQQRLQPNDASLYPQQLSSTTSSSYPTQSSSYGSLPRAQQQLTTYDLQSASNPYDRLPTTSISSAPPFSSPFDPRFYQSVQ